MISFKTAHKHIIVGAVVICVLVITLISTDSKEDHTNNEKVSLEISYTDAQLFSDEYGYDFGIILSADSEDTKILLYNIDERDALLLTADENHKIISEESIKLNEEFEGYSFSAKYGDFRNQLYILGERYRIEGDKIYSSLVCIPKNDLTELIILNSYVLDRGSQGTIPTIIDFTVELIDNYIVYEDVDLYWKVQNINTKEVYSSNENESNLKKIEPYFQESIFEDPYIYILKYLEDNSVLAFNIETKKFVTIENK